MQYPFEGFLVWAIARGWDDPAIRAQADRFGWFTADDFADDLAALRTQTLRKGGRVLAKRLAEETTKPWSKSIQRKLIGEVSDLADGPTWGRLETARAVEPMRQAIELLTASGLDADRIATELATRYGTRWAAEHVACYQAYFWRFDRAAYAECYRYVAAWEETPERDLYQSCLGRNERFVFWRLGLKPAIAALHESEGQTFVEFLQGAQQHLINAVDPMMNPEGKAPTAWVQNYAVVRDLLEAWQEKHEHQGAVTLVEHIREHVRLKKAAKPDLPQLGVHIQEGDFE